MTSILCRSCVGACPAAIALALAVAVASQVGCAGLSPNATVAPTAAPAIPAAIQVGAGERAAFSHFARGVQIYRCAAAQSGGAAPTWAFVAPQAELFSTAASTTVLGTHGAGPFWQAADGSRVEGQVKARADAPAAGAIPWLLLATTANGRPGDMARVTSIQRVETDGGVAPALGCAAAGDIGNEVRVPYTARYVYFAKA